MVMEKVAVVLMLLAMLCIGGVSAACKCDDSPDQKIGNCTVKIHVCGCIQHFPPTIQYDGTGDFIARLRLVLFFLSIMIMMVLLFFVFRLCVCVFFLGEGKYVKI